MQLLFLIIKRVDIVDDIMQALATAGINGATVMDSVGMAKSITSMDNLPTIDLLRGILQGENTSLKGKTFLIAVKDEQVEDVKKAVTSVTGDLSEPNSGVLFGIPLSFAIGIN